MAMDGKAQFKGKRGQITGAIGQPFQRGAQSQTRQIAMNRRAGSPLEEAGQVERRRSYGSRYVIESQDDHQWRDRVRGLCHSILAAR